MSEERDYEAEASKDGWAPEESWKGDPSKWKTAQKFVEDGENINGILKSRLDRQDLRITQLTETNKSFAAMSKKALAREKSEVERLVTELKATRKQAITDGDGDTFEKADADIEALRATAPVEEEQGMSPNAQQWIADNTWYGTNQTFSIQADGIADSLRRAGYDPDSEGYFAELTKQVHEAFPNEFKNTNRDRAGSTEAGGERGKGDSGKKTFDDLPADAKAQYEVFKRDMPEFTKDDYFANYEWE